MSFLTKKDILAYSMLTPTIIVKSIAYIRANLTFCMSKGGTLIRTGGTVFLVLSLGVQGVRLSGIGTHFFIKNPAGGTVLDGQVRL